MWPFCIHVQVVDCIISCWMYQHSKHWKTDSCGKCFVLRTWFPSPMLHTQKGGLGQGVSSIGCSCKYIKTLTWKCHYHTWFFCKRNQGRSLVNITLNVRINYNILIITQKTNFRKCLFSCMINVIFINITDWFKRETETELRALAFQDGSCYKYN